MKKLIVFILAFVIIPFSAFSELDYHDLEGVWTCYIYEKNHGGESYYHMYQFIFHSNYECNHFIYSYYADTPGYILSPYDSGRHYCSISGTELEFKQSKNSTDVQFVGRYSGGYLYISLDGNIWRRFTRSEFQSFDYDTYTSETVPQAFPIEVYDQLKSGYDIPAGIYTVGIDFPSGDYSITSSSNLRIIIKQNNITSKDPTTFDMTPGSYFGKVTLLD